MRHSQTAVLERGDSFDAGFATEPYEAAWAREVRFFVQVIAAAPGSSATLTTQYSPDGLHWVDADGVAPVELDTARDGMVTWAVREFGGWLRVRGTVDGGGPRLRVYLVAKE